MDIFHYSAETREYLGPGVADVDPLDENNWLVPAFATVTPPLNAGAHQVAIFVDDAWSLAEDWRGTTAWDEEGRSVVITAIGPIPAELTLEEPPPPPEPPPPVPPEISRPQCAAEMLARGNLITGPEAVAMAKDGTPPALVEAGLSDMPEPAQTFARIDFARYSYRRDNPLLNALMLAVPTIENGVARPSTEADIDAFFRAAGAR